VNRLKAFLLDRRLLLAAGFVVAIGLAIFLAAENHLDQAAFVLSIAVLMAATATLAATWAQPGRLIVEPQRELVADDLIFFSYPEAQVAGGFLPRDYLLQAHLAVANIGQRTAVLSGLTLDAYLDAAGEVITSKLLPTPLPAQAYRQWLSRTANLAVASIQSETTFPPFPLEADAVLTLRLRWRGGVDWSPVWDLANLRDAAESLARPITQARLLVIYRSGRTLRRQSVIVPLVVQAQNDWRERLATVTHDFTMLPDVRRWTIDPYEGSGIPIAR
jgi:hypothetical protein